MASGYFGGCDVGSTTTKAVIVNCGEIVARSIRPSKVDPEESARAVLNRAIQQVEDIHGIEDIDCLVGTGYGRIEVPFADKNISELTCHSIGAFTCDSKVRSIVDIGGHDLKAIAVNEDGTLLDFVMNDKCAAGTGKFFEAMCRVFEMEFDEFSEMSLRAKKAVAITSQCSVFAESEVLSLISKKVAPDSIALGIQESVAQRCYALLRRVGLNEKVAITGGCAKNKGLVDALTKLMKLEVVRFDEDPQLMGALGAAILARNSH